jgi:hypothetical protein
MSENWLPEQDDELRRLALAIPRISYTTIAAMMGRTKNSVIGRAQRIALPPREKARTGRPSVPRPAYRSPPMRLRPIPEIAPPPPAELPPERPPAGKLTIMDLRQCDCRWIDSDGEPWFYCGEPVVRGLAYCESHAEIAYHRYRGQLIAAE